MRWILGVQPGLDGVPLGTCLPDLRRQRLPLGHDDLQPHQVQPEDALRDRMLDLQASIHLQEIELAVRREQELDCAGADVANCLAGPHRGATNGRAQVLVECARRCLFDDLLVPPLDGALALQEMHDVAVRIAEDLHLDVPWRIDIRLEKYGAVAESR